MSRRFVRGLAIFCFLTVTIVLGLAFFSDISIWEKVGMGVLWIIFTVLIIPVINISGWNTPLIDRISHDYEEAKNRKILEELDTNLELAQKEYERSFRPPSDKVMNQIVGPPDAGPD